MATKIIREYYDNKFEFEMDKKEAIRENKYVASGRNGSQFWLEIYA
jgi:hypothetical protein